MVDGEPISTELGDGTLLYSGYDNGISQAIIKLNEPMDGLRYLTVTPFGLQLWRLH